MAQHENPQRLPQEIESQAAKAELIEGIKSLDQYFIQHDEQTRKHFFGVDMTESVFVEEGGEVLSFHFAKVDNEWTKERSIRLDVRRAELYDNEDFSEKTIIIRGPYEPYINYKYLTLTDDDEIVDEDDKAFPQEKYQEARDVVNFLAKHLKEKTDTNSKPLIDMPPSVLEVVKELTESEAVKYKQQKEIFAKEMKDLIQKVEPIEPDRALYKDKHASVIYGATIWVKPYEAKKDEYRLEEVDEYNNGQWGFSFRVVKKDDNGNRVAFYDWDAERGRNPFAGLRTLNDLKEATDNVKAINEKTPAPPAREQR